MRKPVTNASRFFHPRPMGNPVHAVSAEVRVSVLVPRDRLYTWFLGLDISRVLNGYGPLPAVRRTYDQSGPWDVPGSRRTLDMSGGISAKQEVLTAVHPHFFAYRVTGFTHLLDQLAYGAEARWWFEPVSQTETRLRWNYTFWPRSFLGKLAVYPVVHTIWEQYMRLTIQQMKAIAEAEI